MLYQPQYVRYTLWFVHPQKKYSYSFCNTSSRILFSSSRHSSHKVLYPTLRSFKKTKNRFVERRDQVSEGSCDGGVVNLTRMFGKSSRCAYEAVQCHQSIEPPSARRACPLQRERLSRPEHAGGQRCVRLRQWRPALRHHRPDRPVPSRAGTHPRALRGSVTFPYLFSFCDLGQGC